MGFISQSALRVSDELRANGTPSGASTCPGMRVTDPKAAQCGEVLKGVLKPAQCKLFGSECTPEHPVGALMVSSEGSCAAYYNYEHRKSLRSTGIGSVRVRRMTAQSSTGPAVAVRFNDPQIEMAHGAGGKASRRLVEGLFAPLLLDARRRAARATPPSSQLGGSDSRSRPTASSSGRCDFLAARSASWR